MLFNSLEFAVFLPIVFGLYWSLSQKYRWILLLAASYYFYMCWNVKYVVLILLTTVISYGSAILLSKNQKRKTKILILSCALIVCFGVLFFFKYFNFFQENLNVIARAFSIQLPSMMLHLVLPVGISFYTFQTLSYVIDVYRGETEPEYNFGKYAAFVAFFPQLVAGPIERSSNLLPQIGAKHVFSYENAVCGLRWIIWGLYKKLIVADSIAVYVNMVYGDLYHYKGLSLIIVSVLFSFQIYCDFSGYSDIAVGTAKLFGIQLMKNFKSPYFSASIKEFWSRWHISLSTWFRDYVYIPMGGNRCGKVRQKFNLIVTFLISGLWHGAGWTFVVWGGVHGLAQVIENTCATKKKGTVRKWISIFMVFIFCSCAWVFFRAESIQDALYVFTNAFVGINNPIAYVKAGHQDIGIDRYVLLRIVLILMILLIFDWFSLKKDVMEWLNNIPKVIRWFIYIIFVNIAIIYYVLYGTDTSSFIYFQF